MRVTLLGESLNFRTDERKRKRPPDGALGGNEGVGYCLRVRSGFGRRGESSVRNATED